MDEAYIAKMRACERVHEQARHLRGRFLNTVAVIEHDISAILTRYFCTEDEEKRELFFSEITSRMTLGAKKVLLVKIVKRDYPRYWDENGQFLANLEDIQTLRNKLAHSIVDVSDCALSRPLEDGIGFVQWKGGQPITEDEFNEWEVKANMALSTLSDIKRLLPFKERPVA